MSKEVVILSLAWALTIVILLSYVPKTKLREAIVIFMFKQLITWLVGALVVQFGLIEYPVDFLNRALKTSFSFEYFIYPAICVVFNLYFPKGKSHVKQFLHYFYFCTAMTVIEVIVEKYTQIITYIHWSGYVTWISLFITFYISRRFYLWFFKLPKT